MRVERSREADDDLAEILAFSLRTFGSRIASEYLLSFDHAFALIARHPDIGQPANVVRAGIRRIKHRQHRIFYEVKPDYVLVVRVLHHAMSLDQKF